MKLLFVGLVLSGVVSGKTQTDVFIQKYPAMDQCVYAASKIHDESQWYDGSRVTQWSYCVPIYGTEETK